MLKLNTLYEPFRNRSGHTYHSLQNIEISDTEKNEMISFAKQLDDERLKDLLRPFNISVTQNMLYKFIERNPIEIPK